MKPLRRFIVASAAAVMVAACATPAGAPPPGPTSQRTSSPSTPSTQPVSARDAERLQRVMAPLIRAMNNPRPLNQIKVGIMDDPRINAANAGNGEFYVTRGLLEKANDQQLMGVLAHEIAHEDLRHVAKAQTLGTGLSIGAVILDQIIPGSGALTPIAGQLIARGYSRREEYAADEHGVELLKRVGQPKQVMIDTLQWLIATEGSSSGGFFSTHPATGERIEALKELR
jgi:Zn-dependent protease with chaperone function